MENGMSQPATHYAFFNRTLVLFIIATIRYVSRVCVWNYTESWAFAWHLFQYFNFHLQPYNIVEKSILTKRVCKTTDQILNGKYLACR